MASKTNFDKLETPAGIGKFNGELASKSYLEGYTPSKVDAHWYTELSKHYPQGPEAKFPHARRWFNHIGSYSEAERSAFGEPTAPAEASASSQSAASAPAKKEEDVDDLFAESDEPEEAPKPKEEAKPKPPKQRVVEKSNVILDCKPIELETDMALMEKNIRAIVMDGLMWGPSKLVEVAYGIKKLQITCVIEDEKVFMDDLEEKVQEAGQDLIQSIDVASMVRAG
eukprot:TRINITY_DN58_c0_g2_i1.p1 TRINITY_DN58_c0_g2~~TRINITY_DN58_c0_g2_i1.p1  ORF type:complete len:226 (-),score=73.57 TRINITY_DN58_c0_g2_i1:63-740(-)